LKVTRKSLLIVALLLLGAALFAAFGLGGSDRVSYSTSPVEQGDIFQVVDATGTINAVTTVQVGSQVSAGIPTPLH
jgi:HlyD family secretion protein